MAPVAKEEKKRFKLLLKNNIRYCDGDTPQEIDRWL
jgi:hypothetical protein